jgi:hypothetical protein
MSGSWILVFTWQVKGKAPDTQALISLYPEYLCFLRYLLSSAEFRLNLDSAGEVTKNTEKVPRREGNLGP